MRSEKEIRARIEELDKIFTRRKWYTPDEFVIERLVLKWVLKEK